MGWERALIPRCGALVDAYAKGFPASLTVTRDESLIWPTAGVSQSSDNHEPMAWAAELARAAAWGTAKDYELARATALWWIDQELRGVGLWRHEQATSTPHGGMHLDALVTTRCGFEFNGDAEGLAASDRHWQATMALFRAGATPGGSVILPGDRDPNGPIAEQATAFYRELTGLPHRGPLAPTTRLQRKGWPGDFWVAVRGVLALRGHGELPPVQKSAPLPFLRRPMRLVRGERWHYAEVDTDAGIRDLCDWILVDHEKHDGALLSSSAGLEFGLEGAKEKPGLPGGGAVESRSPGWTAS